MKDPAELCRGLLRKARQDRIALDALLPLHAYDAVCFHAQQAVEKWLKAFLAYHGVAFPHTHNPDWDWFGWLRCPTSPPV